MKKRIPANPPVTPPSSSTPAYHPATGQILSEVEDNSSSIPQQPRQDAKSKKGEPTVTIAPGLRSTRDVFINRPK